MFKINFDSEFLINIFIIFAIILKEIFGFYFLGTLIILCIVIYISFFSVIYLSDLFKKHKIQVYEGSLIFNSILFPVFVFVFLEKLDFLSYYTIFSMLFFILIELFFKDDPKNAIQNISFSLLLLIKAIYFPTIIINTIHHGLIKINFFTDSITMGSFFLLLALFINVFLIFLEKCLKNRGKLNFFSNIKSTTTLETFISTIITSFGFAMISYFFIFPRIKLYILIIFSFLIVFFGMVGDAFKAILISDFNFNKKIETHDRLIFIIVFCYIMANMVY